MPPRTVGTTTPPTPPPTLYCPECHRALKHVESFLAGVRDAEQLDRFHCRWCGDF